ncbi:MAG: AAA family ATPase [Deltaproteobacteria bacterium]|nr:AAA family ATPase [Deltaproteobacteria bacterium]
MLFAFDDFLFDDKRYELKKAGATVKVETSVLKLLAFFLKHPGVLISKQELIDQVWEGRALADNVLSVTVAKLRKALGHAKGMSEYIDNVYGRGYRFTRRVICDLPATERKLPSVSPLTSISKELLLVGRDSVVKRLEVGLNDALIGRGGIYILAGEPGIGKTRICEVFSNKATASGALVAWGRCHDMEGAPPFWLWYRVLKELQKVGCEEEIREILVRRISELALFFQEPSLSAEWVVESITIGHRAADETIEVISKMSASQPLVLVLEDLQWADSASLTLLDYLASETARLSLLVIATLRSTEILEKSGRYESLRHALGHRNCERIEIDRLSEADVADYVTALFGRDDAVLSRAVYEKSEGIPFYMAELLRPWLGLERPRPAQLELSGLALDMVRQRLGKLNTETRFVLSAAAVIGRDFDLGMLSHVTQREVQNLLDILDEPLANETVVPSSQDSAAFTFSHELIREVLYENLAATERRRCHLRAGEGLEKRRNSGNEIESTELARHFLSALPDGELLKAIDYSRRAAAEATGFRAYADARAWLLRALGVFRLTVNPDPHAYCRVLLELSFSERALGDNQYFGHLRQAAAVARQHGFGKLLAVAGRLMNPTPGIVALDEACNVLEAAEASLLKEDNKTRAIVLAHLAWTPPYCLNGQKVNELITKAERLARESKNAEALTIVLRGKLFFTGSPSAGETAYAIADEIKRLLTSLPEAFRIWHTSGIQVFYYIHAMQRGDSKAVQQVFDEYRESVDKLNNVELSWHQQRMRVIQAINRGDFTDASAELKELELKAKTQHFYVWPLVCALDQNFLQRQTSQIQPIAEPFLSRVRRLLEVSDADSLSIRSRKIESMVDFGLRDEAQSALKDISAELLVGLPVDLNYLGSLARLSVASCEMQALGHAEALYDLLKPYAQYFAADISFHCEGSISFFLGLLAQTLGRTAEAIAHYEEAIERNLRFELKAQVARTRYVLAKVLAGRAVRDDTNRARLLLDQAVIVARDLGMQSLYHAAERLNIKVRGA